jgi:glycosyltransferase involved in cell wall biosynthesis
MPIKKHLISVIIPTCNRRDILKRSLHALNNQIKDGRPFEVIVVDDGSQDGTADYLKRASFSFPFKYCVRKHKGPAAARNAGLKIAAGVTALFLNDDCLAAPDLLFQHRKYRQAFEDCAVLGQIKWSSEIPLTPTIKELLRVFYFPYYKISDPQNVSFNYFITGNLSVPIKKVMQAGGFDEDFTDAAFEDIELGYRLQRMGMRICYNPQALAFHFHQINYAQFCDRQQRVAYWLAFFVKKHPELKFHYPCLFT